MAWKILGWSTKSTTQHNMDVINQYSLQNTNYYVWHVVVINNNTPPWLYVKNGHLMLALIVPSRRQVNNMDACLQPLVDELKELWEGIHVYDVSRPITIEKSFTLYGICAYTIHDYLGLGVCSGKLHFYWFVYIRNNIVSHIFNLIHCNCFDLHGRQCVDLYTIISQVLEQNGIMDVNVLDLLWRLGGLTTCKSQCMTSPGYSSQNITLTEEQHMLSMVNQREPKGLQ